MTEALYGSRAELYDKIYAWMDYPSQAEKLRRILHAEGVDDGSSVLEAACGTGAYLVHLRNHFRVSGFDKSEEMLAIARRKLPDTNLYAADMRWFTQPEPARAVVCLFSSIGYLETDGDLDAAARAFAGAVLPGGAVVIEPWLAPNDCVPGHVSMNTVDEPDLKLCRQIFIDVDGDRSTLHMEWLVARRGVGLEHFTEAHTLRLVAHARIVEALERAGLRARYEPDGLMPRRGLVIGRR